MIPKHVQKILKRQGYQLLGSHSAVKACHWLRKKLLENKGCYKAKFYGIESHRCIQMTPAVAWCPHRCLFCWRPIEFTVNNTMKGVVPDSPEKILEEAVKAQKTILTGYWGVKEKVNLMVLREAERPQHVAISLAGEPTLYPYLDELIQEFHRRNFTTFLVTNGLFPENIMQLEEEPTQLYVSLYAPNRTIYKKTCNPQIPRAWHRLNQTLEILPTLDCRKTIRLTLVKELNMTDPAGYAELIEKAEPSFIEPKAFMFVGFARRRLEMENMPSYQEIKEFGKAIAEETGYDIINSSRDSRVMLLSDGTSPTIRRG